MLTQDNLADPLVAAGFEKKGRLIGGGSAQPSCRSICKERPA